MLIQEGLDEHLIFELKELDNRNTSNVPQQHCISTTAVVCTFKIASANETGDAQQTRNYRTDMNR
jgi:hypothetical protein